MNRWIDVTDERVTSWCVRGQVGEKHTGYIWIIHTGDMFYELCLSVFNIQTKGEKNTLFTIVQLHCFVFVLHGSWNKTMVLFLGLTDQAALTRFHSTRIVYLLLCKSRLRVSKTHKRSPSLLLLTASLFPNPPGVNAAHSNPRFYLNKIDPLLITCWKLCTLDSVTPSICSNKH